MHNVYLKYQRDAKALIWCNNPVVCAWVVLYLSSPPSLSLSLFPSFPISSPPSLSLFPSVPLSLPSSLHAPSHDAGCVTYVTKQTDRQLGVRDMQRDKSFFKPAQWVIGIKHSLLCVFVWVWQYDSMSVWHAWCTTCFRQCTVRVQRRNVLGNRFSPAWLMRTGFN